MHAVVQHRLGGGEVLAVETVPRPMPLPTEVLVRVHAAGINPVDWKTREGHGMADVLGEPPFVLGWDVAGVVEEVGFGVTTLAVGDRVYGMPWFPRSAGAYAEYVTAPARQLTLAPTSLSHAEAGAVPLAALTAWQVLVDTLHLQPGQRVLITAGAGGVGHFAVQFARHLGAHVVATASAANHEWLRELGADEVVDYHDAGYETRITDMDAIVELVGGDESPRLAGTLRPGGIIVAVPGGVSEELAAAVAEAGGRATAFLVEPDAPALARIAELIDAGEVRVEVARTFPLEEVGRAHELGETGRTRGKIVLTVDA
ncbi:NADPH:quinone reductase [Promicromonospora thailandica]|uniref:NADPH:quinone reductase n=2 Tax=Promicromonospora thailandica TaxID=765201 RepID=A0A9X2G517_9MICO|nr:NADPH:quinone reductase [Promicromonospora thailandica]